MNHREQEQGERVIAGRTSGVGFILYLNPIKVKPVENIVEPEV